MAQREIRTPACRDRQPDTQSAGPLSLADLIMDSTEEGSAAVRFLVQAMLGELDGFRPADRIAAARELLDRCYGKPSASASGADSEMDSDLARARAVLQARIDAVLGSVDDDRSCE